MKICPNCRKKNHDINNWCGFCGGSLHAVPSERATGRASRTYEGRFSFCPSCGGRLEQEGFGGGDVFGSGLSFCPHCNFDVMSTAYIEAESLSKSSRKAKSSPEKQHPGGRLMRANGFDFSSGLNSGGDFDFSPSYSKPAKPRAKGRRWLLIPAVLAVLGLLVFSVILPAAKSSSWAAKKALDEVLESAALEADAEGADTPAFILTIESRSKYRIVSFDKTTNGAVAVLNVQAPDVYGAAKELDANYTFTSVEEAMAAIDDAVKKAPIVEKQVEMEFIITEDGYHPILTSDFLDAYYGGVWQLRNDMLADAAGKMEG